MKKENRIFCTALGLLAAFALWTAAVCFIDVKAIGPLGSSVGFAAVNSFIHDLTGVHITLYVITDWLGLVPVCFALGFALLGLMQWISRKSILKVDRSILALGVFYIAGAAAYILFEEFPVNYRPVLIGGILEASYPSSTTLLTLCVMPAAAIQLHMRIKSRALRRCAVLTVTAFAVITVMLRFLSGVHWFTDIAGGAVLSAGLVTMYYRFGIFPTHLSREDIA